MARFECRPPNHVSDSAVPTTDLTIRRATVRDAAEFARSMGDPGVYRGLMQLPYSSDEQWVARPADSNSPGKSNDLVLVAERSYAMRHGTICDVISMARLHPRPQGIAAGGAAA